MGVTVTDGDGDADTNAGVVGVDSIGSIRPSALCGETHLQVRSDNIIYGQC